MSFISLKLELIKKVKEAIRDGKTEICHQVQILNLYEHLKYLKSGPVGYLKYKDSKKEVIAHGAYEVFNYFEDINISNHNIIFGAKKFLSNSNKRNKADSFFSLQ